MAKSSAVSALASLANDRRREMVARLARGPSSVGALAAGLPVSLPAVSQHLRVLKEVGMVYETAEGTRRIYRLDPRGVAATLVWLEELWETALQGLAEPAQVDAQDEAP